MSVKGSIMHFLTDLSLAGGELVQNKGSDKTLLIEHIFKVEERVVFVCVFIGLRTYSSFNIQVSSDNGVLTEFIISKQNSN